jgi:hypothetical protein
MPPYYALFRARQEFDAFTRGRRARFASRLPLAFIFRAFGAVTVIEKPGSIRKARFPDLSG